MYSIFYWDIIVCLHSLPIRKSKRTKLIMIKKYSPPYLSRNYKSVVKFNDKATRTWTSLTCCCKIKSCSAKLYFSWTHSIILFSSPSVETVKLQTRLSKTFQVCKFMFTCFDKLERRELDYDFDVFIIWSPKIPFMLAPIHIWRSWDQWAAVL